MLGIAPATDPQNAVKGSIVAAAKKVKMTRFQKVVSACEWVIFVAALTALIAVLGLMLTAEFPKLPKWLIPN